MLSLWDATQLDAAGQDGEVVPTYLNLTDASIKMVDPLISFSYELLLIRLFSA